MQPRDETVPCLAWMIDCSNGLTVTIATVDRHILLLSDNPADGGKPKWRLGVYKDTQDAHQRAVEMTSSYERLREGVVSDPYVVTLPADDWKSTTETGNPTPLIGHLIASVVRL